MNRLLIYILILCGCDQAINTNDHSAASPLFGPMEEEHKVGEPLTIEILNWTSHSELLVHIEKEGLHMTIPASADIPLPESIMNTGGLLHLYLYSKERLLDRAIINLKEDLIPKSLDIRWTPKDVQAGSADKIEVISLARSKHNKSISSSREMALAVNGNIANSMALDLGYSAFYLDPPTSAGRLKVSTKFENLTSEEGSVDIQPSTSLPFDLSVEKKILPADGRSFFTVTAEGLKDSFGNSIADGHVVNFIAKDEKGSEVISSGIVLGSTATTYFQHPLTSGQWTIAAWCGAAKSVETVNVDFHPYIEEIIAVIDKDQLRIGPIKSVKNTLVSDGTPADILLYTPYEVRRLQKDLINGQTMVDLNDHIDAEKLEEITIMCGGSTKVITPGK